MQEMQYKYLVCLGALWKEKMVESPGKTGLSLVRTEIVVIQRVGEIASVKQWSGGRTEGLD